MCVWRTRRVRFGNGPRLTARVVTQNSDCIQLDPLPMRRDAKLFQVLLRLSS
jgi:hypothetical protein